MRFIQLQNQRLKLIDKARNIICRHIINTSLFNLIYMNFKQLVTQIRRSFSLIAMVFVLIPPGG